MKKSTSFILLLPSHRGRARCLSLSLRSFRAFFISPVPTHCSPLRRIKMFLYVLLKDIEFSMDLEMVVEKRVKWVLRLIPTWLSRHYRPVFSTLASTVFCWHRWKHMYRSVRVAPIPVLLYHRRKEHPSWSSMCFCDRLYTSWVV
jgi:hypothetical protein